MKKPFSQKKIRYWFDCLMSKGTIAMTALLGALTMGIVLVLGLIAYWVSEDGSLGYQFWMSFNHTLDPGTLSGNATDNVPYILMMTLATLCGLILTSILIGIIAAGVEGKLTDLRRGTSVVQETGHTTIIGFDNDIYAILHELVEANANRKDACIVVLGQQPKEELEDAIASHIPNTGTTRIICRSGNLHENYALERCNLENSRSIIVNVDDDAETIKILLALSSYLKDKQLAFPDLCFVTTMADTQFLEAAAIAGEGRTRIIYAKDAIARIIANTCRQHGLSQVLTELFNFTGNELYFEQVPQLEGKTFREACLSFSNAIAFGLFSEGRARLNPPMDTLIGREDRLILLEADDGVFALQEGTPEESLICPNDRHSAQANDHLVVLGSNDKLPIILSEYDRYVRPGTPVVVVDDDLPEERLDTYQNLSITLCKEPVTRDLLLRLLNKKVSNLLLMNDDSRDPETSDSQTLVRLILLRDISDKTGIHFSITTEMRSADNQRLAAQARVDDFVIGSNFASLLVSQISENPDLEPVITDLLDESGSELYMKPVTDYVALGTPVSGYTLTESAARKGEIFVGYRHRDIPNAPVLVNPRKEKFVTFGPDDQIVVIAEN